jgi:hypothetical protein
MVIGMQHAEKQTRKTKNVSWSPKFAQAINLKTFWKIALSLSMINTYMPLGRIQTVVDQARNTRP